MNINNNNKQTVKKTSISNNSKRISLDKLVQSNEGVYKNARYMNICLILMGCPVNLKCKSGDTFHGIFATFSPEFEVVLECCHKIDAKTEVVICGRSLPSKNEVKTLIFPKEDIVEIVVADVDKEFAIKSIESNFTDSAIARKINGVKGDLECRALQPFPFEEANEIVVNESPDLDLENSKGWSVDDMLTTNETKYGYRSTFKSDLSEYTVAVEKEDSEDYRKREEEAEKIAYEIESSVTYRNNVDKELSDNEEEEEAFSAVDRTNSQQPQQSSIEYTDNDITGSSSSNPASNEFIYTNSYHNSNKMNQQGDKYINKRNNRNFDQRINQKQPQQQQQQRNNNNSSSINLQNSSNINNSSYKRYPSSNNQQQIKSFERQDSNTSQSNRQYNLPNNNQQIDSQIYHNRRLNKGGPQPVIPSSTIINQADNNKKSYKNTVLKWSTQPPVSSSTQITNTTSQQEQQKDVETIGATTTNLEISSNNTVDTIEDNKNVNNNNGAKKGVLAKSITKNNDNNPEQLTISITEQTTSGGSELNKNNNETQASKNLGINIENENKNANYESSNANDETNNLSSGSEFAKSKLNPFAQEFVFRSQAMSPLNTSNDGGVGIYTTVNQQPIVNISSQGINYQPTPMPPQHLPHGTQIFINPNTIPPNNPALYILNQTPYQQPAYIPSPIPQPPPTQKQKKGVINESTVVNHNHPMTPNNMQQIPPPQPPPQQQQQQQISQIQSQQRNTQISYQPNQGSYSTIAQQQQPPPQNTPTPGMVTSYPPPQIPQQPQNQIIYTTQPPMNYQNPNGQPMTIRYISQNPQMIPYSQDMQNQPVYCPNGQIIYNTIIPNQQQMTQSGVELSGYAPSATTPTRVVNQSAPHTPSPLSQQQQQQQQQQQGHQNMQPHQQVNQQNHIQQYTQQPPQNYAQPAYYYIPGNLPQHMQPGPITYVSHGHPMNQPMGPNQQQYVVINNNQQVNPYQQNMQQPQQQQQQNKIYLLQQNNPAAYSH